MAAIDHEPPAKIETAPARAGIAFSEGEVVGQKSRLDLSGSGQEVLDLLGFAVEDFNRRVITEPFNRAVAEELAEHIDPALPEKTLIFAVDNRHADIVVKAVKEAFAKKYGEIDDAAVKRITGSIDDPQRWIRSFRNDAEPKRTRPMQAT